MHFLHRGLGNQLLFVFFDILGASSGIGKETAILFAELGAKLVLTGRNEEDLLNTKKLCQEKNNAITEVSFLILEIGQLPAPKRFYFLFELNETAKRFFPGWNMILIVPQCCMAAVGSSNQRQRCV